MKNNISTSQKENKSQPLKKLLDMRKEKKKFNRFPNAYMPQDGQKLHALKRTLYV